MVVDGLTDLDPEVATEPTPADTVHPVAPAVIHAIFAEPPWFIVVGEAFISTVKLEAGGLGQVVPLIVSTPEPQQCPSSGL